MSRRTLISRGLTLTLVLGWILFLVFCLGRKVERDEWRGLGTECMEEWGGDGGMEVVEVVREVA